MSRSAASRSRTSFLSRFSTAAIVIGSLLVALGLTALGDSQAATVRGESREHARLVPAHEGTELRVLDWTLWNISKYYVEPDRIDPQAMTLAGLEAIENDIAEVLVEAIGKGDRVRIRVGTAEREFQIGDVEALWAVGPHIREVFRFVNRNTELDEDEQRDAEYAIIAGVLSTLDPHTNLLRPDDFDDMKASTKGSFGGLGIEVGMREGAITVIRVIDGNPASKVDMMPGDRIVQIDAESTVTMNLNEAVDRLRGAPGTTVDLYVIREGFEKPKKLEITRATIKLDSVIGDVIEAPDATGRVRKVGLVAIPRNFAQTTGKELRAKLDEFEQDDVEGVILDLRDNPGGLLNAAVEVADAFVDAGTIVSTVGVSSPREESRADNRYDFPNKPLVVLVDQGSASASEIVAGALRNLGRAVLIGRRTFGKGSVQVLHERKVADTELALKLTIAQYLTPGDVSIQSVGVSPDLETLPVWLLDDQIAYFGRERFDLLREESLASHLDGGAKFQKTSFGPLHFLDTAMLAANKKSGERDKAAKASPKDQRSKELLNDAEVRIARDLILWSPSANREDMLAKLGEFVDRQQEEEQVRIAKALSDRGIDWARGPRPQPGKAARLQMAVKTDKAGNVVRGGETGTVSVTVTNAGDAPAYQVRGMTESDYRYFTERELFFGRIDPGATKTYSLKLSVAEHELSRTDRIDIHLYEQNGAKLAEGSQTSIDVSAEGLPRPQFAYGYQIIDDPGAGSNITGNGDGVLQVGERVKLLVDVANNGEGPALDTWVTLRNLSGEALFLHSGRKRLKELQPGDARVVDLDVELREPPEGGEAKVQLTVSDNKLAEALSEKLSFPVRAPSVALQPAKNGVQLTANTDFYASPTDASRMIASADTGAKFPVTATADGWFRLDLGQGRFGFAKPGSLEEITRVTKPSKALPTLEISPPRVTLMGTVTQTESERIHLSGIATDDEAVSDVFITVYNPSRNLFGNREKVFYQAAADRRSGRLEFAADVPLTPGNNIIEVHAREDESVVAVRRMWVLRTSGLAAARKKEARYSSNGQLRVDTFKGPGG